MPIDTSAENPFHVAFAEFFDSKIDWIDLLKRTVAEESTDPLRATMWSLAEAVMVSTVAQPDLTLKVLKGLRGERHEPEGMLELERQLINEWNEEWAEAFRGLIDA